MGLYKLEIDLSQNPEKDAEQIYHRLRELPLKIRGKLQMITEEFPLTKPFNKDYSMDDSGD